MDNTSLNSFAGRMSVTAAYRGRLFGAVAFVFTGPAKSTIIPGSGFSQEPRQAQSLPGANLKARHQFTLGV